MQPLYGYWVLRVISVIVCCAGFSGCIAVPYPHLTHEGYEPHSHENLTEHVPEFIVPGQTTREEILRTLGAPDGIGPDQSWFTYGSIWRDKGVTFGFVGILGPEGIASNDYDVRVRIRRLLIRFDAQGLVNVTNLEERQCTRSYTRAYGGEPDSEPYGCLDIRGSDIELAAPEG